MKVTTLIDNYTNMPDLQAEHGLSIHVELQSINILFDVGQSDLFLKNAKKLNISIKEVDYLVLSHGHYDHIGGLEAFLNENTKALVIVHPKAMRPKYRNDKSIGFSAGYKIPATRLYDKKDNEANIYLGDDMWVMGNIRKHFDIDSHKQGFSIKEENQYVDDNFDDELFLAHNSQNGLSIISACSHNGITNICETAQDVFNQTLRLVLGGFHIRQASTKAVEHVLNYFAHTGVYKIGICHCTGIEHYARFKQAIPAEVFYNSAGMHVYI